MSLAVFALVLGDMRDAGTVMGSAKRGRPHAIVTNTILVYILGRPALGTSDPDLRVAVAVVMATGARLSSDSMNDVVDTKRRFFFC